ncbi:hypothetical protein [Shewanella chilikensis]|uniref:hypothetical protein n=1 Tax=Shewanella chilikensis TaxID=558541 RepID=UPI003B672D95
MTELMDSRWPQEFLVRLSCLSPDRWHTDALRADVDMLLLDLATVEPALGYKILKQATRNRGCKVVLLHYPRRVEYECLLLPSVVKAHLYRMFGKLNVNNRAQVMAWAQRHLMADVAESQGS